MPRQFAHVCRSVNMELGFKDKPCGCECPLQMGKIRFSDFQTLETIENFAKFHVGQLKVIRKSGVLKTALGQDA